MPVKKNRNLCRQTKIININLKQMEHGVAWHGIIYRWLISHYRECFLSRINISVFLSNVPRWVQPLTVPPPLDPHKTLQTLHCSVNLSLSASPGRGCSVPEAARAISCPAVHTVNRSCCLLSSFHAQSISAHHLLQLPAAEPQGGYEARKPNSKLWWLLCCLPTSTRVEGELMSLSPLSQWHIKPSHFLLFFFSYSSSWVFAIHSKDKGM